MKKKILIFLPVLLLTLCLVACAKESKKSFTDLVKVIYKSEEKLASYNESNIIYDDELMIYSKDTSMRISRREQVHTEVNINEKKLSLSGGSLYDETITSYKTIDNVKYTEVNGTVYQNPYTMPTYYLTFVLSEEFMEDDYELTIDGNNYKLVGKVLDDKISSLFLNKSVNSITNLNIEIVVEDNLLRSFSANYTSTTGFDIEIKDEYYYGTKGKGIAYFYLEGGSCKNSKDKISYIYPFDGTYYDMKIGDPNEIETEELDKITLHGYHIEGWYRTKIVNDDGTVSYKDKWDFNVDRMTVDGVTLYARWMKNTTHTYEVYYINPDTEEEVFVDKYTVVEGEEFDSDFVDTEVKGYTTIGYLDENGFEWDEEFTHPGGDVDVAVKVYLKLVVGDYAVVSTAREFNSAIGSDENIYLLNDIDYDGDEVSFEKYSGEIVGNGHKLYNLTIDYDPNNLKGYIDDLDGSKNHLYVSLFFELKGANIKDLSFENVSFVINVRLSKITNIVVAPFAILASDTKLENVSISGNIEVKKTPDNSEIVVVSDKLFYNASSDVEIDDNTKVNFTVVSSNK